MIEEQKLKGLNMMCSYMKCRFYEISEGTVYSYQIAVSMIKIAWKLLAHNDLLNKHVKEKSFKTRATAKYFVQAKIIEATELNEENDKDKQFNAKNNNEECKKLIKQEKMVQRIGMHNNIKNEWRVELINRNASLKDKGEDENDGFKKK